ncbi:hypothetical protein [Virgisporangium aurantiacum]|uniref:Helix-turn-helix domain-containing protein n=1 Tax=Virgisporangium aurantiacum TaxID=175570 RepID=A0A8J3ZJV4_9ACTN|nr:hypothetical protein [Virgisporangium aurantiacum]GIJ62856.1 hypothetical protein Vau01_103720 [Virgisporangium aurantiacum]
MDNRDEVKAFLSSRRVRITPERAGLTSYNRNRRVPGLRRSEVADLAGVSVEYYAQLERDNLAGARDFGATRTVSPPTTSRQLGSYIVLRQLEVLKGQLGPYRSSSIVSDFTLQLEEQLRRRAWMFRGSGTGATTTNHADSW